MQIPRPYPTPNKSEALGVRSPDSNDSGGSNVPQSSRTGFQLQKGWGRKEGGPAGNSASPDQLPPVHDGQQPPSSEGIGWEQAASHGTFSQATFPFWKQKRTSSHHEAPDTGPGQPPGPLPPTWHQHWEHPASVQRLPDSYMAPRCQQAEDPGASRVAAGPLGKEGVTSCSCEGGPRVPRREARGMGVATRVAGGRAGGAGVGDSRLVVLTPAGGPGAPEGGLCPGERAGRPASGSSSNVLGGGCRGCRMAEGASTAFGKAEMEAWRGLCGRQQQGRRRDHSPPPVTERLCASFSSSGKSLIPPSHARPRGYRDHHTKLRGKHHRSRPK